MIRVNATERWAQRVEWDMAPMTDDAGALFAPRHSSFAREVVPVERLHVELAGRPMRQARQDVALCDEWPEAWSVGWFGELVFEIEV